MLAGADLLVVSPMLDRSKGIRRDRRRVIHWSPRLGVGNRANNLSCMYYGNNMLLYMPVGIMLGSK